VARATLLAFLILGVNSGIWGALLISNLRTTPAIPWASPIMALYLWLMWQYLNGKWWPRSTQVVRHRLLRARPVSGQVFAWSLVVGVLAIVALTGYWTHCLTGNLALSASTSSFPPTLHWSVLQGCKVTHLLCSRRSTWHSLERKRKMFHEVTRERSLSPLYTDRLLHVSRGGDRGTVFELSSTTRIAPTNRPSVP
jgi:hypothetical protein